MVNNTDDLRERIASAIESTIHDPVAQLSGRLQRYSLVQADAVLDVLGLKQVGWWVEDNHRHSVPQPYGTICGEFRFTEEEDGCPLGGTPAYTVRDVVCAVCNGTGLAYDSTECRMVPCGGICCKVKS